MPPRHGGQLYWQQDMTDSHHKVVVATVRTADQNASFEVGRAHHSMIVNDTKTTPQTNGTPTKVKKVSSKSSQDSSTSVVAAFSASKSTSSTTAGVKRIRKHYKVGYAKDRTTKPGNGKAKHGRNTPPPTKKRKVKKGVQVVLSKTNKLEASVTGVNSRTEDDSLDANTTLEAAERAAAARKKARPNARLPTRERRTTGPSSTTTPSTTTKMIARQSEPPAQERESDEESDEAHCLDDSAEDPPPAPVTPPRDPIELENAAPQSPPPPPPAVAAVDPPENTENEPVEHSSELSWDDPVALDDAASIIAVGRFLSVATDTVDTSGDVQDGSPREDELAESSTANDDEVAGNAAHQRTSVLQTCVEAPTSVTTPTEHVAASESQVDACNHIEDSSANDSKMPSNPSVHDPGLRDDLKTKGGDRCRPFDDSVDIEKLDTLGPNQALVLPSKDHEFQEDLCGCDDNDLSPAGMYKSGERVAAQVRKSFREFCLFALVHHNLLPNVSDRLNFFCAFGYSDSITSILRTLATSLEQKSHSLLDTVSRLGLSTQVARLSLIDRDMYAGNSTTRASSIASSTDLRL